ncbi:chemotaxis protein CheB [Coleofasciculus sp. FACHB-1120]|uniref:chemotaxis protein CheB n=1 Tax=Coleofasciculus sp. FACHB-1120 TaxID=2692783 RepID=UPI0016828C64|nr:chemotaxis protein CheB [Coleofasciculus sp. FACHB-1120]MBD2740086.1 chemotaxis protein CheB [Coleofasciculus sp. FACHB-1120]
MPGHDIIVLGASAGGVEALTQLVKALPPDLPAAIFVVIHFPAHSTSLMPSILNRCGSLKASHPKDGEEIQLGRIYVAPPNYHLLVKRGCIHLARGPRENGHRPAIDPLFRTAARFYGRRVVGVVLSGNLDDGTAGLAAVKQRGGVAVVQDPNDALFSGMPRSAIENVEIDYILPLSAIASTLVSLAHEPVEEDEDDSVTDEMEMESEIAELDMAALHKDDSDRPGIPAGFGCPDCGGALWELRDGQLIRFRCRTGHAFSAETLLAEQSEALETALWNAFRALEERAALSRRMHQGARDRNQIRSAARFQEQAHEAQHNATVIRQLLLNGNKEEPTDADPENGKHVEEKKNGKTAGSNSETEENHPAISFPVVAVAASAGGIKAISELLSTLPEDFPAAIAIVQHLDPKHPSLLAQILNGRTSLAVKEAERGEQMRPGTIYIAPPNHHLLIDPDATLSLTQTKLVHFVRPSADLLFESVAASFRERAIAVILSGTGSDGATGIKAIKEMGGIAIAQDQESSECFGMPGAAIKTGAVDWILPLDQIAAALVDLVNN